jgi:hypothetical protein
MPPHSKRSSGNREDAGGPEQNTSETLESKEKSAVGSFLRGLALRAEADATFAVHIQSALEESGLLGSLESRGSHQESRRRSGRKSERSGGGPGSSKESKPTAPLDPFRVFREQDAAGLRETLEKIDLEELHAIVRTFRLDPARISSRWTRSERVIDLIVDQVTAYARHGQAFSRL